MSPAYLLTPFVAWCLAGGTKFAFNSLRSRQLAFDQIGYGGMPSTHSAIIGSAVALVGLREGIGHPTFGVAVAVAFIVALDAATLRREVGRHARVVNRLDQSGSPRLRERMGHSPQEIVAGLLVGAVAAWLVALVFPG